ncbi:hypothetical protein BABINDRAFT_159574 [Babjeviella inositovora NRRL Y-12698]|uniref:Nitrogen permease regulator 2 n=1 Tax=Babjeviella inositovora NRRL Y-12698 TaxID=984486 RepID=A0A1E3QZL8_9ASCO|nr:uncharacterized protein BABINDRAFT_159574 [Babjeviella inositovora NRRL Y-12698]ODQ83120.1 hypothetical protein BABINDRAFT_159574 [Babjeviella inositovora NRRL Y-12698]
MRNSFNFNFCFVFPYESDSLPYESSIRKIGEMFAALEEQSNILSRNEPDVFYRIPETIINPRKGSQTSVTSVDPPTSGLKAAAVNPASSSFIFSQEFKGRFEQLVACEEEQDEQQLQQAKTDYLTNIPQSERRQTKKLNLESLIQQIHQDLNSYSECLIPLDESNSIDIKLFPIFPPPPLIKSSDVPVSTVKLKSLVDFNWDPTMVKIFPFIDGVNSVNRISQLADADVKMTKICIQHLMYYKCIVILDIFQFANIYAPTSRIADFLYDDMADECQDYVVKPYVESRNNTPLNTPGVTEGPQLEAAVHISNPTALVASTWTQSQIRSGSPQHSRISTYLNMSSASPGKSNAKESSSKLEATANKPLVLPSKSSLFFLYRSLHQGSTVRDWYAANVSLLTHIDIRRFITFGVTKGIIYRVRAYPIAEDAFNNIEIGESAEILDDRRFSVSLMRGYTDKDIGTTNPLLGAFELTSGRKGRDTGSNEFLLKTDKYENGRFKIEKRKISFTSANKPVLTLQIKVSGEHEVFDTDSDVSGSDEETVGYPELRNYTRTTGARARIQTKALTPNPEKTKVMRLLRSFEDFDTICTELGRSRGEVETLIRNFGSVSIVNS